MKIEDQVISVEHAKRLKELGVKQESLNWWIKTLNPKAKCFLSMDGGFDKNYHKTDMISAFTVAELGEMLPSKIELDGIDGLFETYHFIEWKIEKNFMVNYYNASPENYDKNRPIVAIYVQRYLSKHDFVDENEADARAQMLIYLIENGLYKI